MKNIVFNIGCGHPLRLRQNEHNATQVQFVGHEKTLTESTLYFCPDNSLQTIIPLTDDGKMTVQINLTEKCTRSTGQIVEIVEETDDDGEVTRSVINPSKLFKYEVERSNLLYPEGEVTDPSIELVWEQLHDLYITVQTKLQNGEFKGAKGDKGDKGDTGSQGPKGDTGATGATGPQGATGPKGDKGDKGDTGADGQTGPQGPQGPTGPAGSDASVTESNINAALDINVKETLNEKVSDVKINGTSVLDADKVANIPYATNSVAGVARFHSLYGLTANANSNNLITIQKCTDTEIDSRSGSFKPIVPSNLVTAVDSVLCSTTASEALTADQQINACSRIGAVRDAEWTQLYRQDLTFDTETDFEINLPNASKFNLYIWAEVGATVGTYGQILAYDDSNVNKGYICELGNLTASMTSSIGRIGCVYHGLVIGGKWAQKRWDTRGNVGNIASGNGTEASMAKGAMNFQTPYKVSRLKFFQFKGNFSIGIFGY